MLAGVMPQKRYARPLWMTIVPIGSKGATVSDLRFGGWDGRGSAGDIRISGVSGGPQLG
jgi:hypothetical protein